VGFFAFEVQQLTLRSFLSAVMPELRLLEAISSGQSFSSVLYEQFVAPFGAEALRRRIEQPTIARFGVFGKLTLDLMDENMQLRARIRTLEAGNSASHPLKRRSPAEWRFRVARYEDVEVPSRLSRTPGVTMLPALRIWVPRDDKEAGPPYWDVTGKTLQAALRPLMARLAGSNTYLRVSRIGEGLGSLYGVSVEPPE
jgi:hypothetical protein